VLASILFTLVLLPVLGPLLAHVSTRGLIRLVMQGGLRDPRKLPSELVDQMQICGTLPGHARAFRSLCLHWKSWIDARAAYPAIRLPVTLIYGQYDWSRPQEREANAQIIPGARSLVLNNCSHFSSLEKPQQVVQIIREAV